MLTGARWQCEMMEPLLLRLITCVMEWFPTQRSHCVTLCQGQCGHAELTSLTCLTFSLSLLSDQVGNTTAQGQLIH